MFGCVFKETLRNGIKIVQPTKRKKLEGIYYPHNPRSLRPTAVITTSKSIYCHAISGIEWLPVSAHVCRPVFPQRDITAEKVPETFAER